MCWSVVSLPAHWHKAWNWAPYANLAEAECADRFSSNGSQVPKPEQLVNDSLNEVPTGPPQTVRKGLCSSSEQLIPLGTDAHRVTQWPFEASTCLPVGGALTAAVGGALTAVGGAPRCNCLF